jgi:hypothetical protein
MAKRISDGYHVFLFQVLQIEESNQITCIAPLSSTLFIHLVTLSLLESALTLYSVTPRPYL